MLQATIFPPFKKRCNKVKIIVAKVNKWCYYEIAVNKIAFDAGKPSPSLDFYVNFLYYAIKFNIYSSKSQALCVNFLHFDLMHKYTGVILLFYDNFIMLCHKAGKTPSAVAIENGITKSNVTYWKKGRNMPSDVTLAKLADYFGVTVSELTAGDAPVEEQLSVEEIKSAFRGKSLEELTDILASLTEELKNLK